jgi:hypothetical protein
VTKSSTASEATTCVWCDYDTAVIGASRCAECGAAFTDRPLIERAARDARVLRRLGFVWLVVCLGIFVWFVVQLEGRGRFEIEVGPPGIVLGLALLSAAFGLERSVATRRRFRIGGRVHGSRAVADVAGLLFGWALMALAGGLVLVGLS